VINAPEGFGRVNTDVSVAVLDRDVGTDYRRASAGADWLTRWIAPGGLVVEPFVLGRFDSYDISSNDPSPAPGDEFSFSRELGLAGVEVSWPFQRFGEHVDWIISPVISGISATDDPEASRLVNEDSISVELDEYLLFDPVRASGHDLWESGQWISYGVRTTAQWADTGYARLFLGRGERLDGAPVFGQASGLFEDESDYVASIEVDWDAFAFEMRTRLDTEDYDVNRLDMSVSYTGERVTAGIRYTDISDEASTRGFQREIRTDFSVQITDDWAVIGNSIHDLDADITRRAQAGFRYQDDCTRLDIVYEREDRGITDLGPSESIQARITLFTLGGVDGE